MIHNIEIFIYKFACLHVPTYLYKTRKYLCMCTEVIFKSVFQCRFTTFFYFYFHLVFLTVETCRYIYSFYISIDSLCMHSSAADYTHITKYKRNLKTNNIAIPSFKIFYIHVYFLPIRHVRIFSFFSNLKKKSYQNSYRHPFFFFFFQFLDLF